MRRKILFTIITGILIIGLVGCGSGNNNAAENTNASPNAQTSNEGPKGSPIVENSWGEYTIRIDDDSSEIYEDRFEIWFGIEKVEPIDPSQPIK